MKKELLSESKETLKQNKTKKTVRRLIGQAILSASLYSAVKLNWLPAKILLGLETTAGLICILIFFVAFKSFERYGLKTVGIKDYFKTLITKYGFSLSISGVSSIYLLVSGWYFTGTVFLLASLSQLYYGANKKSLEELKRILRS
jgi:hypothetical protein